MHCQCHFGKAKSSYSGGDTGETATLRYAIYRTWNDSYHMGRTCLFHDFICGIPRMHPNTSVGFS